MRPAGERHSGSYLVAGIIVGLINGLAACQAAGSLYLPDSFWTAAGGLLVVCKMKLIAAVDNNWAIGNNGGLLDSIPEDMKFFRETTTGHVVVMGRKTLESFPGKRPLKNRVNIVLTRDPAYACEGALIVHDEEELMAAIAGYDTNEVFIIGGASIYKQFLSLCDTAYITKVYAAHEADAFFPDLDLDGSWEISAQSGEKTHEGLKYRFITYKKVSQETSRHQ